VFGSAAGNLINLRVLRYASKVCRLFIVGLCVFFEKRAAQFIYAPRALLLRLNETAS
jgi:hypothetical protein